MTPSPSSEVVRAARGSAADGAMKRAYVRRMFAAVAPRYDLLNHLLSLNLDRRWRRAAVARLGWEARPDGVYLDLCAGTMDLAAALGREPRFRGRVIGADFVVPMLELGRGKSARAAPVAADALLLPFPDRAFDGALVGFGVRNLTDLDAGLRETARVLRPGARFVVLEFATPRFAPLRAIYLLYFRRGLPAGGRGARAPVRAPHAAAGEGVALPGRRQPVRLRKAHGTGAGRSVPRRDRRADRDASQRQGPGHPAGQARHATPARRGRQVPTQGRRRPRAGPGDRRAGPGRRSLAVPDPRLLARGRRPLHHAARCHHARPEDGRAQRGDVPHSGDRPE